MCAFAGSIIQDETLETTVRNIYFRDDCTEYETLETTVRNKYFRDDCTEYIL